MSENCQITMQPGDKVRHERFGLGKVEFDKGASTIVRFGHGIEECLKSAISRVETPLQALRQEAWHNPLEVITRAQAELIMSINDAWGVFSRARIALLPHQLWVCKRVLERWPTRWLIADDVGLGKTIEAGLILWPLLANNQVQRLLVICPASLAPQWQSRMLNMFDIRLTIYSSDSDSKRANFWEVHNSVAISLQTIRKDHDGRHERLFESASWDLLVVDEAHHLNADEEQGPTLGYKLVKRLVDERRVRSMVFFTGTPHRGKNFGFLSLMHLLRPDLFDPKQEIDAQLPHLAEVMIRNNKQNVTNLKGERLFRPPVVNSETYHYSAEEAFFYQMLTEFIATGKAYASSLPSQDGRAVILVLITMQKLASSSVAAIRRALTGRLMRIEANRQQLDRLKRHREDLAARSELRHLEAFYKSQPADELFLDSEDQLREKEEEILRLTTTVRLMEDEEPRLRQLVRATEAIREETKVNRIMEILRGPYAGRPVLFFTEYKATQSLLLSVLQREFGDGCAAFINGDERAEGVLRQTGEPQDLRMTRETAADLFNAGKVRFLVSTEAGGEGIDLQENCHSMIHVDLPWNPMRLHQRVGRLNRYGQKRQVEVITLRNPETVESRIWEKLNGKIIEIMRAFGNVMDEPEDLMQLVLGMTSPSLFVELFSDAPDIPRERLAGWFDAKTASFGGTGVIDTVKQLIGHSSRFDYQQVVGQLPQLDLPVLKPFIATMLTLNGRRVSEDATGRLSFKTPEVWLSDDPGMRENFEGLTFSREERSREAARHLLGVGHKVMDKALAQARQSKACVTSVPAESLGETLGIFRIIDRITGEGALVRSVVAGVRLGSPEEKWELVRDADLLLELNRLCGERGIRSSRVAATSIPPDQYESLGARLQSAKGWLEARLASLALSFQMPEVELFAVIVPMVINVKE